MYFTWPNTFLILVLFSGMLSGPALAKPQTIVSINVCTDQLLMLLADREHIASISYLAVNKAISAMADKAVGIVQNHGLAEEIMLMNPDLILAGTFTSRATVFLLKKLAYNLIEIPVATNFDDIRQNIRTVANAIGEPERGQKMIRHFNQRLSALEASQNSTQPVAVFYRENNYTTGNHTLANTLLEAAGFINLATRLGISGSGYLPLETLITQNSDVIILGRRRNRKGTVAVASFDHPAFKLYARDRLAITISDPAWLCGTPFVLDAIDHLVSVRKTWQNRQPLRTCSRSLRATASCVRTERRNRILHGVNEDFEYRSNANGSGAVDLEQVLKETTP